MCSSPLVGPSCAVMSKPYRVAVLLSTLPVLGWSQRPAPAGEEFAMPTEFVMLPPQTEKTREWGARLADALPELKVVVAENHTHGAGVIAHADAAFGVIPPDLLPRATRLRWLQAPQAAPPAGYYYPDLIAHPVAITNFREIYNDHIGTHVMAFVLAFARGLHRYIPQQLRREWKKLPQNTGVVHLPEATALVVGVGGIGSEVARLASAFGVRGAGYRRRRAPARRTAGGCGVAPRRRARRAAAHRRFRDPDRAAHPGD